MDPGAIGSLVAPLVITPLAIHFGWRTAFFVIGALGAFWVILWFAVTGRGSRAAEAMRRILVDQARRKLSLRQGGNLNRLPIEERAIEAPEPSVDILAVHEALDRFQGVDATAAQIVKLRYFAGLTTRDAAQLLGISTATADRYWAYARAWLQEHMAATDD